MAFLRWRGTRAQLLATVYEDGRSRQVVLANLGGAYTVHRTIRARVDAAFPHLHVDWAAIDGALAVGPPGSAPLTPEPWTWETAAHALRDGARCTAVPRDRGALESAAAVLTGWMAGGGPADGPPGTPSTGRGVREGESGDPKPPSPIP